MHVADIIEAENKKTLALLKQLEDSTTGNDDDRRQRRAALTKQLLAQKRAERDVFHAALAEHGEVEQRTKASAQGLDEITELVGQLEDTPVDAPSFQHRAEALRSRVEQHLRTESETLLPSARLLIPADRAEVLATSLLERKREEEDAIES